MPGPETRGPREYLIINGKNVSPALVDIDWVKAHCPVKGPERVQ